MPIKDRAFALFFRFWHFSGLIAFSTLDVGDDVWSGDDHLSNCPLPPPHCPCSAPGWRCDALSATAESVLRAGLTFCVHNEAPPVITSRCLALTEERKSKWILLADSSAFSAQPFWNALSVSFWRIERQERLSGNHVPSAANSLQTGVPAYGCALSFVYNWLPFWKPLVM